MASRYRRSIGVDVIVCVCFFFLSVEEVVASGRWFDLMWEWLASTSRLAAPAPQYSRQSEPASPNIPHTSPHVRLEAADAAVDAEEEEEAEAVADTLLLAAARLGDDREGKWEEACEVAAVVAIASRHVHSRQTAAHSLTLLPPPSCPAACRSCLPGSVCVGGHEPRQSIDRPCGCVWRKACVPRVADFFVPRAKWASAQDSRSNRRGARQEAL